VCEESHWECRTAAGRGGAWVDDVDVGRESVEGVGGLGGVEGLWQVEGFGTP